MILAFLLISGIDSNFILYHIFISYLNIYIYVSNFIWILLLFLYRHVAHLGWDINNKGLELDSVDSELQQFFNNAGVSEYELQDKGTRKFIYDFIERNGGMSAVQEDIRPLVDAKNQNNQPPALPQRQEYPPPVPARTITVSFLN